MLVGTLCGTMIMLKKKQPNFENVGFFSRGYVQQDFMCHYDCVR